MIKWFKSLFNSNKNIKETNKFVYDIPDGVDESNWSNEVILKKVMETRRPCYGAWDDGKLTITVN